MPLEKTVLPNGLTVLTDSFASVETVSLGVWLNVGTRHETKVQSGISHALEHMAFKGTTTRSALAIAEEIENVGGYLNAYTSRESTAYYARVLKEDVALATDILSDILQNSVFDKTELEKEQSVIIQEIGQSNDTPDDVIFDHFQETCFPDQPMGWPTLGTADVVKSLTPTCIKNYMSQFYGAKQMVFAAAGNVDHQDLVVQVQKKFIDLKKDCAAQLKPAEYKGGDFRNVRSLEQVHLILGFESVPYGHALYHAVSVLSTLLGGGMSSRLFQEIREKRGLVYSIYSYASSYRDTGIFGIYAGTGADEVAELMPVLCDELKQVSQQINVNEIQRAKAQLKAGLLMGLESTSGRCERLANQHLIYGKSIPPQEVIRRIDAVTTEDIMKAAAFIFKGVPTFTTLGPIQRVMSYSDICDRLAC